MKKILLILLAIPCTFLATNNIDEFEDAVLQGDFKIYNLKGFYV